MLPIVSDSLDVLHSTVSNVSIEMLSANIPDINLYGREALNENIGEIKIQCDELFGSFLSSLTSPTLGQFHIMDLSSLLLPNHPAKIKIEVNDRFNASAKAILQQRILNALSRNINILKIQTNRSLFDLGAEDQIDQFLRRNNQIHSYYKKLNSAFIGMFVGILLASSFILPLSGLLLMGASLGAALYSVTQIERLSRRKLKDSLPELGLKIIPFLGACVWFNPLVAGVGALFTFAGLFINHHRDQFIQMAFSHYRQNQPSMPDEIESMRCGLLSQRNFLPSWGLNTWRRPSAYYVGLYETPEMVERRINSPRV